MSGLSLVEMMVGVAITGIVSVIAMNQFSDFTRRQWEAEAKARAVEETEMVAEIIKKTLPQFVYTVTGPNGETQPPATFWSCTNASQARPWNSSQPPIENCSMNINYPHIRVDGSPTTTPITPIQVKCVKALDNVLRRPGVDLKLMAGIPASTAGFLDSSCLTCPWDTSVEGGWVSAPQVTVNTYNFDATTDAPSVSKAFTYPSEVGSWKRQGILAMGVCVNVAGYTEKLGSVSVTTTGPVVQTYDVTKYDKWKITLVPVYSRMAPRPQGALSDPEFLTQVKKQLQANRTDILITAPQRFAPNFKVTPVK